METPSFSRAAAVLLPFARQERVDSPRTPSPGHCSGSWVGGGRPHSARSCCRFGPVRSCLQSGAPPAPPASAGLPPTRKGPALNFPPPQGCLGWGPDTRRTTGRLERAGRLPLLEGGAHVPAPPAQRSRPLIALRTPEASP